MVNKSEKHSNRRLLSFHFDCLVIHVAIVVAVNVDDVGCIGVDVPAVDVAGGIGVDVTGVNVNVVDGIGVDASGTKRGMCL